MTDLVKADICVVGAGSAGLTVAAGASQLGAATVLIEGRRMGGDCLNYGCVPSKALLAAGHAARAAGGGVPFGIAAPGSMGDRKSTRSELQSLMRLSYAVFCLKKKTEKKTRRE